MPRTLDVSSQPQQGERVAVELRQIADEVIVDDFANLRICGPEQRGLRRHGDFFSGIADFEGDVDGQPVANVQFEWRARVALEAGQFRR